MTYCRTDGRTLNEDEYFRFEDFTVHIVTETRGHTTDEGYEVLFVLKKHGRTIDPSDVQNPQIPAFSIPPDLTRQLGEGWIIPGLPVFDDVAAINFYEHLGDEGEQLLGKLGRG